MRDPLRIKTAFAITDGFTVLSAVTDENGKTAFEDLTKKAGTICLLGGWRRMG
jgi:hypothetical protein